MKNLLSNRIYAIIVVATLCMVTACKKDKDPVDLTKKTTITLSGAQEVPANASTGTGTGQISFNPTTKIISYNFTWQLGSTTATTTNMHFHGAEDGSDTKSSVVAIGITGFTTASTGTMTGQTVALTDAQVNQLLAGKWYLNIHSSTVAGGELRGNIKF
jgi:uncharacterized membrane protein